MKVSTKGRYGVRAMLELARLDSNAPMNARSISEEQGIPIPYLEKILFLLNKAGLVRSIKGPGGGYLLAKSSKKISIGDIVRVLEGPIALVECLEPSKGCDRIEKCVAMILWKKLSNGLEQTLDEVSLYDLLIEEKNLKIAGRAP
jgi:Rrf2 family protein